MLDELTRELVRRRDSGLQLDDREHHLAPLGIGNADHRDVADGRMREQLGLDLRGIDVDAARDDEVRRAIGEEQVAVVVEIADVAEREVVAAVARGRLVRVLVVVEAAPPASALRHTSPTTPGAQS